MSTSSGISVTPQLESEFKSYVSPGSSHNVLLASIKDEQIEHVSSHAFSQFQDVIGVLSSDSPMYIFYKPTPNDGAQEVKDKNQGALVSFVMYIPESTTVRNKMLYAASSAQLLRQLGGSNFAKKQLYLDSLSEFNHPSTLKDLLLSFETSASKDLASGKSIGTGSSDAPLTIEEEMLRDVKEKEAETAMRGTRAVRSHVPATGSSGSTLRFAEGSEPSSSDLKSGDAFSYSFNDNEELELISRDAASASGTAIPSMHTTRPQFSVFQHSGKTVFVYSCPSKSQVKQRMIYAINKQQILNLLKSKGVIVDKDLEVTEDGELELELKESIDKKGAENSTDVKKFVRPKRPGRR